jgi:hypothetical protein
MKYHNESNIKFTEAEELLQKEKERQRLEE